MKTMKAGAVVLLGLVLAGPAWGGSVRFVIDPDDPLRCEVEYEVTDDELSRARSGHPFINFVRQVGEKY